MLDPSETLKPYTKNPKCLICKHKKCAEIDRDLRSDPDALDVHAKTYKVQAIALVGHAYSCLGEPVLVHAVASEEAASKLHARGLQILQTSTLDAPMLRAASAMLAKAAELRASALAARGVGASTTDLARSEPFKVFIRGVVRELMDPRFAIDDHAALKAIQKLCEAAMGRV